MAKSTGNERNEADAAELKALNHPLRQRIMAVMLTLRSNGRVSPREISTELSEPLCSVSYHVRVLAECKAITLRDIQPVRGSVQHFYSPNSEFLALPWVRPLLAAVML